MNNILSIFISMEFLSARLFVFILFIASSFIVDAQPLKKNSADKASLLIKNLTNLHYAPPALNDKFSSDLYKDFLNALDYRRLYFTKEDLAFFNSYKYKLDDELQGKSWNFLPLVIERFKLRLTSAEKIFTEILKNPIVYNQSLSYENPSHDTLLFFNSEELNSNWKKWLRFQQLNLFYTNYAGKNPDSLKSNVEILKSEQDSRMKMEKLERRYIAHLLNHPSGYEECITSLFLNTVAEQFDPHTNYFSKLEFEKFKSMLSSEEYSFGVEIDEDEIGNIIVSRLIPGGPAWKSNLIHKGDIITELKWEKGKPIELGGSNSSEVAYILSSSNSEKLEFSLRKANGLLVKIALKKEKLDNEENSVKGYILQGEKKIAYISLPGFYTEWDSQDGKGCANDVAKEIVKLKEEHIDGLILDLRDNGGGSTYEALGLMGIFIDEGPLFMKNNKLGKPIIMKDINRGTIYDGPLLVMINGSSASASEIVASTLQDYNRALITGSSSYGKATEQTMVATHSGLPLVDNSITNSPNFLGVLKVTESKLYRITGSSNQMLGVKPDFLLPELADMYESKESNNTKALTNDYINKKVVYSSFHKLPIDSLMILSTNRIKKSSTFIKINELNKVLPQSFKKQKTPILLTMEEFRKRYINLYKWQKLVEALSKNQQKVYSVTQHNYDKILYEAKVRDIELINKTMDNIEQDCYIQESFSILSDFLKLNK